jgi:hypothetical protein
MKPGTRVKIEWLAMKEGTTGTVESAEWQGTDPGYNVHLDQPDENGNIERWVPAYGVRRDRGAR